MGFEAPTGSETTGSDSYSSFRSQSLTEESEAGKNRSHGSDNIALP